MRLIAARAWTFMILSALLQVSMFPIAGPVPLWRSALCWGSLVPFLVALLQSDITGKSLKPFHAAILGYSCGILWYIGNCSWIYQTMYLYGGLSKQVAAAILLLFAFYLGLYHALFAILLCHLRNTFLGVSGALLLSPFLWVAVELTRARITGFPWDLLGNIPVDNLLFTRLVPYAGVMALSFLIVAINAGLASAFLLSGKRHLILPVVAVLLACALELGGAFSFSLKARELPATSRVVMMQENLSVGVSRGSDPALTASQELDQFSRWSLHPDRSALLHSQNQAAPEVTRNSPPDLIVWPEAPSHLQSNDPAVRGSLAELARIAKAPVIAGNLGVDADPLTPRGYLLYDSATVFAATGDYLGRYDKIHLVPWGEFIPFKSFFSFAHKLTEGAGDMDRGYERTVFRSGGHSFGIFICYESIFGDEVRQFVRNGAEVLVNISDDGWYGDSGAPWQHLNMARMRAIENRRWVLRSTNTGITTAIDPLGRIAFEAPRHVRAAFTFPFEFNSETTFYTRHGDWFAWLCVLVTLAALAFTRIRRSNRRVLL